MNFFLWKLSFFEFSFWFSFCCLSLLITWCLMYWLAGISCGQTEIHTNQQCSCQCLYYLFIFELDKSIFSTIDFLYYQINSSWGLLESNQYFFSMPRWWLLSVTGTIWFDLRKQLSGKGHFAMYVCVSIPFAKQNFHYHVMCLIVFSKVQCL